MTVAAVAAKDPIAAEQLGHCGILAAEEEREREREREREKEGERGSLPSRLTRSLLSGNASGRERENK